MANEISGGSTDTSPQAEHPNSSALKMWRDGPRRTTQSRCPLPPRWRHVVERSLGFWGRSFSLVQWCSKQTLVVTRFRPSVVSLSKTKTPIGCIMADLTALLEACAKAGKCAVCLGISREMLQCVTMTHQSSRRFPSVFCRQAGRSPGEAVRTIRLSCLHDGSGAGGVHGRKAHGSSTAGRVAH